MRLSYQEHFANSFNRFLTHFHGSLLDRVPSWNFQSTATAIVMCKVHHRDKLRFFNFVKWLITRDNPFSKMLLKLLLVPQPLHILTICESDVTSRRDHHLQLPVPVDLQRPS
jgi:hypothetical protein